MDPAQARLTAIRVLGDVLARRVRRVGELRRAWPESGADFLLKRARLEAQHYLTTKGELERRFVSLMQSFLERGGTPEELERAYDAVIGGFKKESGS
ncbi:MAG: hypothetical protein ACE5JG_10880 [Planctomycetota bacterium]